MFNILIATWLYSGAGVASIVSNELEGNLVYDHHIAVKQLHLFIAYLTCLSRSWIFV